MESAQEVRYSGVVVGRGAPVRDRDASGAFVVLAEPLPVGTRITLRGEGRDEDEEARVTVVTESANPDLAGMRIVFVSAAKPAAKSPPVEAPPPAAAKPPVLEKPPVIVKPPEPQPPPVVAVAAAAAPASPATPVAAEAPHAAEAAPTEVPGSDSTASSATPTVPTDLGMGGKRRRRRR